MNSIDSVIYELHQAFIHLTGQQLRMGLGEYHREYCWAAYLRAGFTKDDLRTVILHLKRGIAKEERRPGCLRFSNLIERLELFEEELAMARAELRNQKPPPSAKERVVHQFRPTVTETASQPEAKPVSFYIEQLRNAAK